jgi:ubiquinone/menaquinone biosynthesis C-methylase UbiE
MENQRVDPKLAELSTTWDTLGTTDAMWAIYSASPEKLGGHWDPAEFFATGVEEIGGVVDALRTLGAAVPFERVLDFGCGVGRLSRALSAQARSVVGVDIAPSMIEQAKLLNSGVSNIEWVLNRESNLSVFKDGEFDLIYTNIVLQHMRPEFASSYLAEFFRITKPGGWVVFQLPDSDTLTLRRSISNFFYNNIAPHLPVSVKLAGRRRRYPNAPEEILRKLPIMQMFGRGRAAVAALVARSGGSIALTQIGGDAGEGWDSVRYYARKNA